MARDKTDGSPGRHLIDDRANPHHLLPGQGVAALIPGNSLIRRGRSRRFETGLF